MSLPNIEIPEKVARKLANVGFWPDAATGAFSATMTATDPKRPLETFLILITAAS